VKLSVGPAETHNVVLESKENTDLEMEVPPPNPHSKEPPPHPHHQPLYLTMRWNYLSMSEDSSNASGTYNLRIRRSHQFNLSSLKEDEEAPLVFQLHHQTRVSHDFNTFPFFNCPVELILNSKWSGRITLQISRNVEDK
jgi:hypothetical protein